MNDRTVFTSMIDIDCTTGYYILKAIIFNSK